MGNNNKKKQIILIAGAVLLVALIVGAAVLYNYLKKDSKPEQAEADYDEFFGEDSDTEEPAGEESDEPENAAPDFTVEDGDGNKVSLSDFRGKPVVVNFWASWCPPCKEEMPDFEKLYKEYGENVVFMMVNLTDGYQETKEDADEHISSEGYTFPVYYDTELDAAITYGVSAVPVTFFVDKNGGFVMGYRGMLDYDTVHDGIKQITGEN